MSDLQQKLREALSEMLERERRRYEDNARAQEFFRQNNAKYLAALQESRAGTPFYCIPCGEMLTEEQSVCPFCDRETTSLDCARGGTRSAETEGLRSLRTAKPGPKDAPVSDPHSPQRAGGGGL